jgi:hypothetical protein
VRVRTRIGHEHRVPQARAIVEQRPVETRQQRSFVERR